MSSGWDDYNDMTDEEIHKMRTRPYSETIWAKLAEERETARKILEIKAAAFDLLMQQRKESEKK